jgi:hypothetical protein
VTELRFPKPEREDPDVRRRRKMRIRNKRRKESGRLRGINVPLAERDDKEKHARGYVHPRTAVRKDGSEVLFGVDWIKRKQELWLRSDGMCENPMENGRPCCSLARDPHHVERRSQFRDDRLENLLAVCGPCHDILDGRDARWTSDAL